MTRQAGLWIDHRKAVIVTLFGGAETTHTVESNVERHVRYSGGSHGGNASPSRPGRREDSSERRFEGHLAKFYDEVIAIVRDAEAILLFGPGEAKGEFRVRLEDEGLGARVLAVETVDKMTDGQIVARVRERMVPSA